MRSSAASPQLHTSVGKLLLICLLSSLTCAPGVGQAGSPALKIGGHEIALGMPVDRVIASLRGDYAVRFDGSASLHEWDVESNSGSKAMPLGSIYAKGNSVVGVKIAREANTPDELFDVLFKASLNMHHACTVGTGTDYLPGPPSLSKAEIVLNCGVYQVVILRNEFAGSDGVAESGYVILENLGTTH